MIAMDMKKGHIVRFLTQEQEQNKTHILLLYWIMTGNFTKMFDHKEQ